MKERKNKKNQRAIERDTDRAIEREIETDFRLIVRTRRDRHRTDFELQLNDWQSN